MKKLFVLLLATTSATVAMAGADYDKPVRLNQLPAAAQELIQTHFSDVKVTLSTVDREFMDTTYDVIFANGTQIEFDSRGQWKEIDGRLSVPVGVLPQGIVDFINENYPDTRVNNIERDGRGFEVNIIQTDMRLNLNDGMKVTVNRHELYFDSRGNFMGYDD